MPLPRTSILWVLLLVQGAPAQTLQHRRPDPAAPQRASAAPASDPRQALPTAAEGEYRWGEPGEVIELYVEDGALRGYLTRRSERAHADSAPMTFAFAAARTAGPRLSFSTRPIHGDWYSFEGQVVRGSSASPRLDGYYLLQGTLSIHPGTPGVAEMSASEQPRTSQVSLKLTASRRPAE